MKFAFYFMACLLALNSSVKAQSDSSAVKNVRVRNLKMVFTGYAGIDGYWYFKPGIIPNQYNYSASFVTSPKWIFTWDGTIKQRIVFQPYFRADAIDKYRTHGDISEGFYAIQKKSLDASVGIRTISWSNMLGLPMVDVMHQIDAREDIYKVRPLGQPMAQFGYNMASYNLKVYIMPFFRPKLFPNIKSRLSYVPLNVNEDATFSEGKNKSEYAVRLTRRKGNLDLAINYFKGYSPMPVIFFDPHSLQLMAQYNSIQQTGIEAQYVFKNLIIKAEGIMRQDHSKTYFGSVAGLEYSFENIGNKEISVYFEYCYDEWKILYHLPFSDTFFGMFKCNFNDVNSTEASARLIFNRKEIQPFLSLEIKRRLSEHYTLSVNQTSFIGKSLSEENPMRILQNNNNLEFILKRFF